MKVLVVGLGSMGKRRVRCLQALGVQDITGIDPRADRRAEAAEKYGISVTAEVSEWNAFEAVIVSTPPDMHSLYAKKAIDHRKPVFIEASVVLQDVEAIADYNSNGTLVAPSCTLRFHPMIKDITGIIRSGKYGKVTNYSYHSGQYLPDWHPWEKVTDYYVSRRETGGAREIVPFELTWMVDTLGWPLEVKGYFTQTIDFGPSIEDTYALVLKYERMAGTLIVDVAARHAVRNLIVNLENAQIQWRWDDGFFRLYEAGGAGWIQYEQPKTVAAAGYNPNIGEEMYIEELAAFFAGISGKGTYPNSLRDDIRVLRLLNDVEKSDGGF